MCYYIGDKNYLAHSRDEIIGQINAMRARFKTYQSYAEATFEESFLPEELEDAYILKCQILSSSYLENLGSGKFELRSLPKSCQMGPIEGIIVEDFDGDGNLDALLAGNSYTTEVTTGRYDAIKGIMLVGDGQGGFTELPLEKSGFLNDLDASGMALTRDAMGNSYVILANNNGPLRMFELKKDARLNKAIKVGPHMVNAEILFKDGRQRKMEFYYGSGYLSQGSRSILLNDAIKEIRLQDVEGRIKTVYHD
jgi:hypothetical protein